MRTCGSKLISVLDGHGEETVKVRHAPAHLQIDLCENPLEEWLACNNSKADRAARIANQNRSPDLPEVISQAKHHASSYIASSRELRTLYFAIATADSPVDAAAEEQDEPSMPASLKAILVCQRVERDDALADRFPLNWKRLVQHDPFHGLPACFISSLLEWLLLGDAQCSSAQAISWLELTVGLILGGVSFPVPSSTAGQWVPVENRPCCFERPTLARHIQLVKKVVQGASLKFGIEGWFVGGIDLVCCRVFPPQAGIWVGFPEGVFADTRTALVQWTASRPVRTAADLARPF